MITICLDAGHGKDTPGKRCSKTCDVKETHEWVINDKVADAVEIKLKNYCCKVVRTDDKTGKNDISLLERCKKANSLDSDIFVSIHHNSTDKDSDKATGVEIYCYPKAPESTKKIASKMYNSIIAANKNKGNRAQGVRYADFYVLKNTKMHAVLIENGFMNNKEDVKRILSSDYQNNTAQGIADCLIKCFNIKKCSKL